MPVQEDFKIVVKEHIEYVKSQSNEPQPDQTGNGYHQNGHVPNGNALSNGHANGHIPNGNVSNDTRIQDLEDEPIETISKQVGNGVAYTVANGVNHLAKGHLKAPPMANGYASNGNGLPMYSGVNYMDGHI